MGYSFIIVNIDRQEYLNPFSMPCSNRFPSIILNKYMSIAITALVCDIDPKQLTTFYYTKKWMGAWKKNEIKIINDVTEEDLHCKIYHSKNFTNISFEAMAMLIELDKDILYELAELGYKDEWELSRKVGPIALLENNLLQFELDKKFGNRQKWINAYYKAIAKFN